MICPNESDRFTVSSTIGNGALTYPVGLLTVDEVILAGIGGNNSQSSSFYLNTRDYYWTMSPYYFSDYSASAHYVNGELLSVSNISDSDYGVRPVVSLKLGTEFDTGGDGTPTNPYVVKYN